MTSVQPLPGGPARRRSPAGAQSGSPLTFVDDPSDALALVAQQLAAAEVELAQLIGSDVGAVTAVSGHLVAAGGKRLRPALTALGALAVGDDQPLPALMCVGELIHLGSLLHDDVVDGADARRGRLSANVAYGNAVSVLTGDFCLARAVWLAAEHGGRDAVAALGQAVTAMAEGEVLQLQRAGDLSTERGVYLDVIDRKSAALIAWCCSAGAYRVGDLAAAEALERFGRGVGVAFQITDDVLDYAAGTGKTPGQDLRERKVTLPLLLAMERVPGLREQISAAADPSAAQVSRWMEQVRSCGALEASLTEAGALVDRSLEALSSLPPSPAREALRVLGRHLADRAT